MESAVSFHIFFYLTGLTFKTMNIVIDMTEPLWLETDWPNLHEGKKQQFGHNLANCSLKTCMTYCVMSKMSSIAFANIFLSFIFLFYLSFLRSTTITVLAYLYSMWFCGDKMLILFAAQILCHSHFVLMKAINNFGYLYYPVLFL